MTDSTEVGTDFDADFRIRFQRRYLTVCHRHWLLSPIGHTSHVNYDHQRGDTMIIIYETVAACSS